VLEVVAEETHRVTGASIVSISRWEREEHRLRCLINVGDLRGRWERFPADEVYPLDVYPMAEPLLHEGVSYVVERTDTSLPATDRKLLEDLDMETCVGVPVVVEGRIWGLLDVFAGASGAPLSGRSVPFLEAIAGQVGAAIGRAEVFAHVSALAFTDPLTGLANRRAVDIRLDEALEQHRTQDAVVSLVVCDLNGLKAVNDTHGHAVGDRLLERFGSVLSLCGAMLPGALAARLGGDEFCLLTVGPGADDVIKVATELCARAEGLEYGEGVACGIASTGDEIGPVRTARRLFRLADAAQYQAKAERAGRPVVAGRDGEVIRLADSPPKSPHDRRRLRGNPPPER
jgi:diguanylate cyclase (GGDEF)-like protein